MKNILRTIIIAIIISVGSTWYISTFGVPFIPNYNGRIVKDTSTQVIQERIEEYKKTVNMESDITKAIDNAAPSVVSIISTKDLAYYMADPVNFFLGVPQNASAKAKQQKIKTWGWSGIIISKDWYILTNKHVISDENAEYSVVTANGDTLTVKNIRRDPLLDIAILQVVGKDNTLPTDLQPANFISFNSPIRIGQFTVAIGNALAEYTNSATFGIISAKNRSLDLLGDAAYIGLYQTDAPINPWNSGGPLINTAGEVIGMNTAMSQGEGIWFALPLTKEFMQTSLTSLQDNGTIQRPYLGIQSSMLSKAAAKNLDMKKFEWVYIQSVQAGSPAALGGLLSGDVITEINGSSLPTDMPILYSLYTYKANEVLHMLVYRNKEYMKIDITLWTIGQTYQ